MSSVYKTIFLAGMLVVALPSLATKVGDVASGLIVSETDKVLVLRTDPCVTSATTIAFSAPWRKKKLAPKKCPDRSTQEVYEVEQLPAEKDNGRDNEAGKGTAKPEPKEKTPDPGAGNNPQPPPNYR